MNIKNPKKEEECFKPQKYAVQEPDHSFMSTKTAYMYFLAEQREKLIIYISYFDIYFFDIF